MVRIAIIIFVFVVIFLLKEGKMLKNTKMFFLLAMEMFVQTM